MTANILKLPSEQVVKLARAMARDNGQDPDDYEGGIQLWEHFEGRAREQVREQTLILLARQVQQCAFTPEEIVRATVDILESRA